MFAVSKFLCGCDVLQPIDDQFGLPMDTSVEDNEGYDVCSIHGARLYGWRSPMIQTHRGRVLNWAKMGTPSDYEPKFGVDTRDTRDPEELGAAILSKRNGAPSTARKAPQTGSISSGNFYGLEKRFCWKGTVTPHTDHRWADGVNVYWCPGGK